MANREDLSYRSYNSLLLPSAGLTDGIPTFSVQDICTGTDSLKDDNDLSDNDEEQHISICVNLTQDCPTVQLPILLLSKISMKSGEAHGALQSDRGMRGKVYEKLPSDIREAVMKTHQLNTSTEEFFKKSQWKMYLQSKRALQK